MVDLCIHVGVYIYRYTDVMCVYIYASIHTHIHTYIDVRTYVYF